MRIASNTWICLILLSGCEPEAPRPHREAPKAAVPAAPVGIQVDSAKIDLFGALPATAGSKTNPDTEEKAKLGRLLYFDARLSKGEKASCNGCHDLATFGVDGKDFSTGATGKSLARNTP